jgi:hypothetical protein
MLPGFRFLLAAIVLCISILVFGLGAAALLRAAHEEFAQNPSWRAAPQPRFAQAEEGSKAVLAMLRIEPVATGAKMTDAAPAEAGIASRGAPAAISPAPDEDEAPAPRVQETSPPIETAKADTPLPPLIDTAAPSAITADRPDVVDTKVAAVEQAADAAGDQPAAAQPMPATPAPQFSPATARVATLGGPPVAVETETSKESASEQDREEARKRRAQRAKERRRLAARRARLARQQAVAPPPPPTFDLFAQQTQVPEQQLPQQQVQQQQVQQQQSQQQRVTQQTVATRRTR